MDKTPKNIKYIVGIDEVGRGPIAGPVAVCAFMCQPDFFNTIRTSPTGAELPKLKDSKKLSEKQRNIWFNYFKQSQKNETCNFAVSFVSQEMIDTFGINKCIKKALESSLKKLNLNKDEVSIFLDGGLHAPEDYIYQETIIRGDELHPIISSASIVAKVSRDRVMKMHAKEYPDYGFENHVGYGTKTHYDAIKKYGLTPLHRKTFLH